MIMCDLKVLHVDCTKDDLCDMSDAEMNAMTPTVHSEDSQMQSPPESAVTESGVSEKSPGKREAQLEQHRSPSPRAAKQARLASPNATTPTNVSERDCIDDFFTSF